MIYTGAASRAARSVRVHRPRRPGSNAGAQLRAALRDGAVMSGVGSLGGLGSYCDNEQRQRRTSLALQFIGTAAEAVGGAVGGQGGGYTAAGGRLVSGTGDFLGQVCQGSQGAAGGGPTSAAQGNAAYAALMAQQQNQMALLSQQQQAQMLAMQQQQQQQRASAGNREEGKTSNVLLYGGLGVAALLVVALVVKD